MRLSLTTTVLVSSLAIMLAAAPGCSKSRKGSSSSSTVAPSTSGTTAPPTSSTTAPIVTPTPPPAPAPLTDVMVSSWQLQEVIEVDAAAGTVSSRWATGNGPTDVVNDASMSYVSNALSQDVTVIDRLANNVVGSIDCTTGPLTGLALLNVVDPILRPLVRPTGVGVTPSGDKVYSANLLNLTVIDANTMTPTKSILGLNTLDLTQLLTNPTNALGNFLASPVRGLGMAKVATNGNHAFVTCMISGTVMKIDALTDRVVGYYDVGRAPIGIAIAGDKAYVACAISQDVYVLDVNNTGTVLMTLTAGMIPVDVAVSPSEDRIYVSNAISGDITVIDTAADLVIDTLPAGMSIASIFQQFGITLPSGTGQTGIQAALNGFLQGFASGLNNPASFGALVTGGTGALLSPATLINGLITGFLSFAGLTQQQVAGLHMPGIGIMSISVAHDPTLICAANAFMGELAVTETISRSVNPITGLTGLGPANVKAIWRR